LSDKSKIKRNKGREFIRKRAKKGKEIIAKRLRKVKI